MRLRAPLWLGAFLVLAAHASAGDWAIERFQWTGSPRSGTRVEIVNRHGEVRTRSSGIDEIEILANIQRAPDDPYEAVVQIDEGAQPFGIEVVWTLRDGSSAGESTPDMEKRRVDLTVILPRTSPLRVRTGDGLIEAKGHGADVTAESATGEIRISTEGAVAARTDHGAIDAVLSRVAPGRPSTFETVTGDITVWLPPDATATVEAETRGVISTDYSIDIRRPDGGDRKVASATIGGGGPKLQVHSTRGQVRLFRRSR